MSILPQNPAPAYPGRRWEARHYPGTPSICTRFRAELCSDLLSLTGVSRRLRDDIELCASEAFANAVTHSRSQRPGGTVIRMLSTPVVMGRQTTLRLSVIDDGPLDSRPMCPPARRSVEDWEQAGATRKSRMTSEFVDWRPAIPDT